MSEKNIQTTTQKNAKANKKESAFVKSGLAWGVIGGVFALCIVIAAIVIVPLV